MVMVLLQVLRASGRTVPISDILQHTRSGRPVLSGAVGGARGLHIRGRGEMEIGRVAYV